MISLLGQNFGVFNYINKQTGAQKSVKRWKERKIYQSTVSEILYYQKLFGNDMEPHVHEYHNSTYVVSGFLLMNERP